MSAATRERILDAAERLLGRYGYRKMTVDDIATEAGIGKGTVYLSFPSKEEAVLGTVERIVDMVCSEMEAIARSDRPAPERVRAMLLARILIRFDRVTGYRESLNDLLASIRPRLLERRSQHFAREIAILAKVIQSKRLARALVLATNHLLPYSLSPAELGDRRRLHRDAADVVDLLVTAITKKEKHNEKTAAASDPGHAARRADERAEGLHHHAGRARAGHQRIDREVE